jgi:hypothetical protein
MSDIDILKILEATTVKNGFSKADVKKAAVLAHKIHWIVINAKTKELEEYLLKIGRWS